MNLSARFNLYISGVLYGETRGLAAAILRVCLAPLSLVYRLGLWVRNAALRTGWIRLRRAPLKVISVGNLTVGGTGKTPLVLRVAQRLSSRGRPVVLSRGYGQDETLLLKEKLRGIPILIGKDRAKLACRAAEELGASVAILDDGFQHRKLARDWDIVTLDAERPFGTGRLLPWGTLREPLSALKRADCFMLVRTNGASTDTDGLRRQLASLNPDALIFEASYRPSAVTDLAMGEAYPVSWLKGRTLGAFAGIAKPYRFFQLLKREGATVSWTVDLPDHFGYRMEDVRRLAEEAARRGISWLVTTEKDRVKLEPLLKGQSWPVHFACLGVSLEIASEDAFFDRLDSHLAG